MLELGTDEFGQFTVVKPHSTARGAEIELDVLDLVANKKPTTDWA